MAGAHDLGGAVGSARDHDHLEGLVELLVDEGLDRPLDGGLVVPGDHHRRQGQLPYDEGVVVGYRLVGQRRQEPASRRPGDRSSWLVEQMAVRVLPLAVRVDLVVLRQPGLAQFVGEGPDVLDAKRRTTPPLRRDRRRQRHEVQPVVGERMTGPRREEASHPQDGTIAVPEVTQHAVVREHVGVVGVRGTVEEGPERGGVVGGHELVGVE